MNTIRTIVFNQPQRSCTASFVRSYSTPHQYGTLSVTEPKKNVFHVELARPEKLNTFNSEMFRDLGNCFKALHNEPACRVIVLSGQGKMFTAGVDLKSLTQHFAKANEIEDPARRARYLYNFMKDLQEQISTVEDCTKPVINLIHNACIGAGVNLTTAADIRYCTEDAWFTVKEVDVGFAADVGALQRLPKIIGNVSTARELCFTARKFDAKEAKEMGLVSKVFPDKETGLNYALAVAEDIASKSPIAVQATKQNLIYSQDKTPREGLEHIALINSINHQSEDLVKSALAIASKGEKPEYKDV